MERRILQPEQVIVPGEYELGNESILKIYFRIFDRGHCIDLPPVIVARTDLISSKDREKEIEQRLKYLERLQATVAPYYQKGQTARHMDELRKAYEDFETKIANSPYYLLDGNHKSAAATLTHNGIHALELQFDADIVEVKRMIERGELFDFKRSETSLSDLVYSFERYILGENGEHPEHIGDLRTVRERIDELTSNGDLPQYMKERYHRGK